jgi:hypothetical protein
MQFTFKSTIREIGKVNGIASISELANEPMLFGADWGFADANGGHLTHKILTAINKEVWADHALQELFQRFDYCLIDTRVTQCMRGWYPCIPGWHCDAVPRSQKYSQPDLHSINGEQHFLCLIASCENHTLTEFLREDITVEVDEENVWGSIDREVTNTQGKNVQRIKEGNIYMFDQQTLHRGTVTENPGWRLFFRLSCTNRKPTNEIRRQCQVYIPENQWGW